MERILGMVISMMSISMRVILGVGGKFVLMVGMRAKVATSKLQQLAILYPI